MATNFHRAAGFHTVSSMRFLAIAAGVVLIIDWATKTWIRAHMGVGARLELLPGWMHLQHVQNRGAAWSVLAGHRAFLVGFTLAVILLLGFSAREIARRGALAATAFGLILGGALGNFLDRALLGYVTDFFRFDTPVSWLQTFPVFNVADSALTMGVVLMLGAMIGKSRAKTDSAGV